MTVICPHCGEPIAGPRLKRLGREAKFDIALCRSCEKSWRLHLNDQGEIVSAVELVSDHELPANAIIISRGSGWGEGLTLKVGDP
jgi:hypothetical protein